MKKKKKVVLTLWTPHDNLGNSLPSRVPWTIKDH